MPPITYEDVARDAATRVMEKFREQSAESRSLTMRATGELYERIRVEVLATLEQFGASPAMGAIVESAGAPEPEIAAGAVVRLRSGGPLMTVGDTPKPMIIGGTGGPVAACFWHDDEKHAASGLFPAASLVPARHGEPALVEAALELWGPVAILDGNERDWAHPFDYYQSPASTRRIVRFGKSLAAVDGKSRSFVPRER